MNTILVYVQCYWLPFVLGGVTTYLVTYLSNRRQQTKNERIVKHVNKIRRGRRVEL